MHCYHLKQKEMITCKSFLERAIASACTISTLSRRRYDTIKTVHIKNKRVGFIFRSIQLAILGYIVGYAIVLQKGYQDTDAARSSVISKVWLW